LKYIWLGFLTVVLLLALVKSWKKLKKKLDKSPQAPKVKNMAEAKNRYDSLIKFWCQEYNFPHDWRIVKAIISVESSFNPYAISKARAMGLCQIIPLTWFDIWSRLHKDHTVLAFSSPFNPEDSIRGCIIYLNWLLSQFQEITLALFAYHSGPKRVVDLSNLYGASFDNLRPFLTPNELEYVEKIMTEFRNLTCFTD